MDPNSKPPRVFISYSWTSEDYRQWIVNLAERLAGDGVHAILDAWDLNAGQDMFAFMEKMVTDPEVKHVLLMCDPRYAEKADARAGGVGSETQIVSKEVYAKTDQKKFIPVVTKLSDDGQVPLPAYLSSRIYVNMSDPGKFAAAYEELLRLIFERPARKRPEVGQPPSYLFTSDAVSPSTRILRQSTLPIVNTHIRPNSSTRRLAKSILADLDAQRLRITPVGEPDEVILAKIQDVKELRDVTLEWFRLLLELDSDQVIVEEISFFFEQLIALTDQPREVSFWSEWRSDHLSFFAREVWLYIVAILIDARKWDVAKKLLETTLCVNIQGKIKTVGFGMLDCYLTSLEQIANSKKERKRLSVLADFVKERADDSHITFDLLMQVEFVLCLRGVLGQVSWSEPTWCPRTLVFVSPIAEPFPIFVRWRVGQMLDGIPALLGVPDRSSIYNSLMKVDPSTIQRYRIDYRAIEFVALADLQDLARETGSARR